jgi:hypothetical protein
LLGLAIAARSAALVPEVGPVYANVRAAVGVPGSSTRWEAPSAVGNAETSAAGPGPAAQAPVFETCMPQSSDPPETAPPPAGTMP